MRAFRVVLSFVALLSFISLATVHAQSFSLDEAASATLPAVHSGDIAWGDFDNDGDPDVLITGLLTSGEAISEIYQNDNGLFTAINAGLKEVSLSAVAWGDFDNDNDLDLVLTGLHPTDGRQALIYRNNNGAFEDIGAGLEPVEAGAVAWADVDQDGDLDLGVTGEALHPATRIYKNEAGTFIQQDPTHKAVKRGVLRWLDFDKDGDPDLLISGTEEDGEPGNALIENKAGRIDAAPIEFDRVFGKGVTMFDYDTDGDLDLFVSGINNDNQAVSSLYQYNDGSYWNIEPGIVGLAESAVVTGDYDNDGDIDLILTGKSANQVPVTSFYQNKQEQGTTSGPGTFELINTSLPGISGTVSQSDYDGDGDLDLLLSGLTASGDHKTYIYKNTASTPNSPPSTPTGLFTAVEGENVTFFWDIAPDDKTPIPGITYALRVGTTPGGHEVISASANADGTRLLTKPGHIVFNMNWKQKLPNGTYYWSVQAIDQSLKGSSFAQENSFTVDAHFTEIELNLSQYVTDLITWGDFDNDGYLDFAGQAGNQAVVYRNEQGSGEFTLVQELTSVYEGSLTWTDYNNDGYLDLFITASNGKNEAYLHTNLYGLGYTSSPFQLTEISIEPVSAGAADWGDVDNDGDLDLALTGCLDYAPYDATSRIYINEEGQFKDLNADLQPVCHSITQWVDYDLDGDLDLFLAGGSNAHYMKLYRNDQVQFNDTNTEFPPFDDNLRGIAAADWGDYDGDGDPDLLLAGSTTSERIVRIYTNTGGTFSPRSFDISPMTVRDMDWGDFDNDGDLDIIQIGYIDNNQVSRIFRNNGFHSGFSELKEGLRGKAGSVAWVDFDNDGDLDLTLAGIEIGAPAHLLLYKNIKANLPNSTPDQPINLSVESGPEGLKFLWAPGRESEYISAQTFNLRLGATSPSGTEIKSPLALPDGRRLVADMGNVQQTRSWTLDLAALVHQPILTWAVQSVGVTYTGSPFAIGPTVYMAGDLYEAADVPGDQGGFVTLRWHASDFDSDVEFLTHYSIWRSLDGAGKTRSLHEVHPGDISLDHKGPAHRIKAMDDELIAWELVGTQEAHKIPAYSFTTPTVTDSSSEATGRHYFMVSAHTNDRNIFFDSAPIPGYSVDNIEPSPPQNMEVRREASGVALEWSPSPDPDIRHYLIFRSETPGIDISTSEPLATTANTSYVDESSLPAGVLYYTVAAEDVHDNLSLASAEISVAIAIGTEYESEIPDTYALHENYPNPFNPSTLLRYDLPEPGSVKVAIYNTFGQLTAVLVDQDMHAGRHQVAWHPSGISSGVYYATIQAGSFTATRKLVYIK